MKYDCCYLPNGIQVGVTPVFEGFKFQTKTNGQNHDSFPPEWIVCLSTIGGGDCHASDTEESDSRPFTVPTLDNDALYVTSISMPPCRDLKPRSAPTRLVAIVLWVTFFWYFQEPDPTLAEPSHASNPDNRTKQWRLNIQCRGMLSRKDQMPRLERLGMVACDDIAVGSKSDMFISQKAFWQLDPRIHLFSISPVVSVPGQLYHTPTGSLDSFGIGFPFGAGPNTAGTYLPPYYPPPPLQYSYTGDVRHPLRPRVYIQGEIFYIRWIPSDAQYLTFRVPTKDTAQRLIYRPSDSGSEASVDSVDSDPETPDDPKLVYGWLQRRPPDTALARRESLGDPSTFLESRMCSQNSFPVLVCWGSEPTGYFELFWVLEDPIGRALGNAGDFDRGVRYFTGNEGFLESKQLTKCISALVHHCWLFDLRTYTVVFECRADSQEYALSEPPSFPMYSWMLTYRSIISALESIGFSRVNDVKLPNEHNTVMTIHRANWVAPVL